MQHNVLLQDLNYNLCIHSTDDEYLGCFPFGFIMNSTVNICLLVHICMHFCWIYSLGVELLCHGLYIVLALVDTVTRYCKTAVPIYILTSSV